MLIVIACVLHTSRREFFLMHIGCYGQLSEAVTGCICWTLLDKSNCKIAGSGICAVLRLISKKDQVNMYKEGALFFCFIAMLQNYPSIFSTKTQHLCFNCQALNKIFTLKTKIYLPFSMWAPNTVVFSPSAVWTTPRRGNGLRWAG